MIETVDSVCLTQSSEKMVLDKRFRISATTENKSNEHYE